MNYGDTAFILWFSALVPVLGCGLALVAGVRRSQAVTVLVAFALLLLAWVLGGSVAVLGPGASLSLGLYYGLVIALTAVQLSVVLPHTVDGLAPLARARAIAWVAFVVVWALLVQFAAANWTLNLVDGWLLTENGYLDFGGSAVLFLSTGSAVLAWLAVHRTRGPVIAVSTPRRAAFTIALLWAGFFAITVGSAAAPDETALRATANTVLAPIAAVVAWAVVERIRHHRVSLNGAVRGVFAGLVAVTAAADVLSPLWAAVLGLCAGALASALAGPRGSVLGLVLTQLTASVFSMFFIGILGEGVGGLLTGSWAQLTTQLFAVGVVAGFAFLIAAAIAVVLRVALAQFERWTNGSDHVQ